MRQWLVTLCVVVSVTSASVVSVDAQISSRKHEPHDDPSLMPGDFQSDPVDMSKVYVYPLTTSGWRDVVGWAGAVKGKASVKLVNRRTGESSFSDANPDGSFNLAIRAAQEDKLLLVAHDTLPAAYSAAKLEAWVHDADTEQPLEGVIIVAQWELRDTGQPGAVGSLTVMETVTDANGHFSFPAWGPRAAPPRTFIWDGDPNLLFFKPDFEPTHIFNKLISKIDRSSLRHSEWDGKTILLKKFTGSVEEYVKKLGTLDQSLKDFAFRYDDCSWKQIPRMLIALDKEETRLLKKMDKKYEAAEHVSITNWNQSDNTVQKCGSMMDFLR